MKKLLDNFIGQSLLALGFEENIYIWQSQYFVK